MSILDVLLPPACSGCGSYGSPLCDRCLATFRPASGVADRFLAADRGLAVGDELDLAVAAFVHEGVVRRSLARLKYGGAARLAKPLAECAAPTIVELLRLADRPVLVPVPVHAERRRERGYNQAALLAEHVGRLAGLPVADILVRVRPTGRQHRLGRAQRLRNLRSAFGLRTDARAPPHAILIDDILTTSATLEACASVLRRAGSVRVLGFAVAREI